MILICCNRVGGWGNIIVYVLVLFMYYIYNKNRVLLIILIFMKIIISSMLEWRGLNIKCVVGYGYIWNIFVVKSSSFENYVLVKLNLIYVEKCVKLL